jgi:hypothetical protein
MSFFNRKVVIFMNVEGLFDNQYYYIIYTGSLLVDSYVFNLINNVFWQHSVIIQPVSL